MLRRRFPQYTKPFRRALTLADRLFPGQDIPNDDHLACLWGELSSGERSQIFDDETDFCNLSVEARQFLRDTIRDAQAFEVELNEMSDVDFRKILDKEQLAEAAERTAEAVRKELWAPYNSSEARSIHPDWRYRSNWTDEQGVALAMQREPAVVNSSTLRQSIAGGQSPFLYQYQKMSNSRSKRANLCHR